jgi:hypothetical protein
MQEKYNVYYQSPIERMAQSAYRRNQAREEYIWRTLESIRQLYAPPAPPSSQRRRGRGRQSGGEFGKGYEAQLERTKTRDVAGAAQQLISSGLYGSTTAASLGKKWEEDVGAPARLKLEDLRMDRYVQAWREKAAFQERIVDEYPDYGLIAGLQSQIY